MLFLPFFYLNIIVDEPIFVKTTLLTCYLCPTK